MLHKALLIPINRCYEIFIQDRRNYKKPDWGFFGGGIEDGEQPIETVIREAKEELEIALQPTDLEFIGTFTVTISDVVAKRHCYLYRTEQIEFNVREGKGGVWLSSDEVAARLDTGECFEELWAAIKLITS